MNFKPLAIEKFKTFSQNYPDYTFGKLICSMLATMKVDSKNVKTALYEMKDEDVYIALDRAMRLEFEPKED